MDSTQNQKNLVESLAQLAAAAMTFQEVNGIPVVHLPEGHEVHDLEGLLPHPTQIRVEVKLFTLDAFIDYFLQHNLPNSAIFARNKDEHDFTAIIDFHQRGEPAWGRHRATYPCMTSTEWTLWTGENGKKMTQEAFATFLEDNLGDIVSPDGASMLEVATTLQVKRNVEFQSSTRLSDGQVQFSYQETQKGSTNKGMVEIPERFVLGIAPFHGGERYELTARLRYRLDGGRVVFWYDLLRPDKIQEEAFNRMVQTVEEKTKTKPFMGWAPINR
ncbi:MAG: DUF2303 family protein [Magnetococcales bacterium]|nr:DUF2303 family protein [Magnetococcales bacterium]